MSNAKKIAEWRLANPNVQITEQILLDILALKSLWGAELRYANLWGADLRGAELRYANLWGANLWGAELRGAELRYANLRGADLRGADLWGANLRGAELRGADLWGGLRIDGSPSHQVTMVPTPDGWDMTIGCEPFGLLQTFRAWLDDPNRKWPEATEEEQTSRLRYLEAVYNLAVVHADVHADKLAAVVEKWGA